MARDSILVATAAAVYDAAGLEPQEGIQIPADKISLILTVYILPLFLTIVT